MLTSVTAAVPAAQPPAGGDVDHRAPARAPSSSGPSRPATQRLPASKTTPRTAGRRRRRAPAPGAPALRAPRSAAASIRKGCRRSSGRRTIENDDRLQYDVFYRREGETTWKVLKRGLWDPIFVWDTTSVPDGTYVSRSRRRTRRRTHPNGADRRAREQQLRHRQHAAAHRAAAGTKPARARSISSSSATRVLRSARGVFARRQPVADGLSEGRHRGLATGRVRGDAGRERAGRSVIIRAMDAMNNVATAVATGSEREKA